MIIEYKSNWVINNINDKIGGNNDSGDEINKNKKSKSIKRKN